MPRARKSRSRFSGKVSGNEVDGTVSLGDFGEFPWTATKDAAAVAASGGATAAGTWRWEHEDLQGRGTVKDVLILKESGGKLSGTYEGPDGKQDITNAKLEGNTLTWGFDVEAQGQTLTITWKGDISGDNVDGNVTLGDFGEFPWSAKRDPAQAAAAGGAGNSKWQLTIAMPDGNTQTPILEVKESADGLSATYSADGQQLEVSDMTADEQGNVSWTLSIPEVGLTSKFSGKVEGTTAKGVVEYEVAGETGELDWTAEQLN